MGNFSAARFKPPVFHVSLGRMQGPTHPARRARLGLGALAHGAWTYWGHSGAPLVSAGGVLEGVHNTYDVGRNTRHCVRKPQSLPGGAGGKWRRRRRRRCCHARAPCASGSCL